MPKKLNEIEATQRDILHGWIRLTPYMGNRCKCQYQCPLCSRIFWVIPNSVWNGNTQSCGCHKLHKVAQINQLTSEEADIKDAQVGFTALSPYINSITKRAYKCPLCGSQFLCRPEAIWRKNTNSCGCYHKQRVIETLRNDLTTRQFGRLFVLRYSHTSKLGRACWKCLCDCGNTKTIQGNSLLNGVQSCGCTKSKGELLIKNILKKHDIDYIHDHGIDGCDNINGHQLRFDFYIPAYNLCIEYHGEQHYTQRKNRFGSKKTSDTTIEIQKRDQIKRDYCISHNIQLLEISHMEYENIEQILQQQLGVKQ